jgi:opacity protein-like surface antigen
MKTMPRFLIPLAALFLVSAPALAEVQYRFEFFGAANMPQKKDFEITVPQSTVPLQGTYEFSTGARGGVRFGADNGGHWGQDFLYSYGANAARINVAENGAPFSFTPRIHQISWNALWYPCGLRKSMMSPFLTAGIGGTLYRVPQQAVNEALDPNRAGLGKIRSDNTYAFNAGGGVRIRVNRRYGLRIDFRDYMSKPPRYGLPKSSNDPNAVVFPVAGIFHQFELAFAFVYYF